MAKKVIKIDNSQSNSAFTFVPRGQNFPYTVESGDIVEFKTSNANALYYLKQQKDGAIINIQNSFDGADGGNNIADIELIKIPFIREGEHVGDIFKYNFILPATCANGTTLPLIEKEPEDSDDSEETAIVDESEVTGSYNNYRLQATVTLTTIDGEQEVKDIVFTYEPGDVDAYNSTDNDTPIGIGLGVWIDLSSSQMYILKENGGSIQFFADADTYESIHMRIEVRNNTVVDELPLEEATFVTGEGEQQTTTSMLYANASLPFIGANGEVLPLSLIPPEEDKGSESSESDSRDRGGDSKGESTDIPNVEYFGYMLNVTTNTVVGSETTEKTETCYFRGELVYQPISYGQDSTLTIAPWKNIEDGGLVDVTDGAAIYILKGTAESGTVSIDVLTADKYVVVPHISNGSIEGLEHFVPTEGDGIQLTIEHDTGYTYPDKISVRNADGEETYNPSDGTFTLSNARGVVTVEATCQEGGGVI